MGEKANIDRSLRLNKIIVLKRKAGSRMDPAFEK